MKKCPKSQDPNRTHQGAEHLAAARKPLRWPGHPSFYIHTQNVYIYIFFFLCLCVGDKFTRCMVLLLGDPPPDLQIWEGRVGETITYNRLRKWSQRRTNMPASKRHGLIHAMLKPKA